MTFSDHKLRLWSTKVATRFLGAFLPPILSILKNGNWFWLNGGDLWEKYTSVFWVLFVRRLFAHFITMCLVHINTLFCWGGSPFTPFFFSDSAYCNAGSFVCKCVCKYYFLWLQLSNYFITPDYGHSFAPIERHWNFKLLCPFPCRSEAEAKTN